MKLKDNPHITTINDAYTLIIQLTDGETDTELKEYYNKLCDRLQDVIKHIDNLERQNQIFIMVSWSSPI